MPLITKEKGNDEEKDGKRHPSLTNSDCISLYLTVPVCSTTREKVMVATDTDIPHHLRYLLCLKHQVRSWIPKI
jgi:hypothetical protein